MPFPPTGCNARTGVSHKDWRIRTAIIGSNTDRWVVGIGVAGPTLVILDATFAVNVFGAVAVPLEKRKTPGPPNCVPLTLMTVPAAVVDRSRPFAINPREDATGPGRLRPPRFGSR